MTSLYDQFLLPGPDLFLLFAQFSLDFSVEPPISPLLNMEEVVSSFRAPTPSPSQAQEAFGRPHPPPPSADSVTAETKILHLYHNSSARRAKHQQCRAQND